MLTTILNSEPAPQCVILQGILYINISYYSLTLIVYYFIVRFIVVAWKMGFIFADTKLFR